MIVQQFPRKVFPEYYLVRVNVYDKIPESPLDEWMTYLKTGKVKEDTRTPGLKEVKEKLRYLSMSPREKREYDAHMDTIMVQNDVLDTARDEGREEGLAQGLAEGRAEGLAQGREEGRSDERRQIAVRLIALGLPNETIAEATGLTDSEIDRLR